MPTAMIDHLEVNYLTRGFGPALLMLAPGGFDAKLNGGDQLARHMRFARENGLAGVVKRAHAGKSFWQDPEAGPWASVIVRDPRFADEFQDHDLDRYLGRVGASALSTSAARTSKQARDQLTTSLRARPTCRPLTPRLVVLEERCDRFSRP